MVKSSLSTKLMCIVIGYKQDRADSAVEGRDGNTEEGEGATRISKPPPVNFSRRARTAGHFLVLASGLFGQNSAGAQIPDRDIAFDHRARLTVNNAR